MNARVAPSQIDPSEPSMDWGNYLRNLMVATSVPTMRL